jgi:hypothetical protein
LKENDRLELLRDDLANNNELEKYIDHHLKGISNFIGLAEEALREDFEL